MTENDAEGPSPELLARARARAARAGAAAAAARRELDAVGFCGVVLHPDGTTSLHSSAEGVATRDQARILEIAQVVLTELLRHFGRTIAKAERTGPTHQHPIHRC